MVGKEPEGDKFMIHENYEKSKFQCPYIKFSWHTAMPIHLHIARGCFLAAGWRWVGPAGPPKPQIPPIWIFTENANLCSIRKSYLPGVQLSY